jgi:hypothetical protein
VFTSAVVAGREALLSSWILFWSSFEIARSTRVDMRMQPGSSPLSSR